MIILWILELVFTFVLLAQVVDVYFVETLEIISKRLKLSSDIAGATFMAVGSSAPELFVSILALFRVTEQQAMGAGTIVGSAIFNILVIIGASALVKRAVLTWQPVIRDLVFYIVCIILLLFTFRDGAISLSDAIMYVSLYVIYLLSFNFWKKLVPYEIKADNDFDDDDDESLQHEIRQSSWTWKNALNKLLSFFFADLSKRPQLLFLNFGVSVIFLALLSHFMVESAVHIAQSFGIPEVIIALTILATGTSIPDLMSSISVAQKGQGDMAIANAVGSNIFDIAIGLGLPWLVIILWRGESVQVVTENLQSSIVLLFATVIALLFLLMVRRWEIGRYAGILLIGSYFWYLFSQIGWISWRVCFFTDFCFGM
ncbi:MAG: calcium/sodium antiporter [Ardenticatenaceae bacterium]|nr:calcium/sodium antiporter [Anaerolineales bacterium]MCB8920014.1 calcium/sodium antiporter [Ardenticatenaceae bacterium]MCB8989859.1 calcium/sodium antiporter [Ardenticatenaceae bacterium]